MRVLNDEVDLSRDTVRTDQSAVLIADRRLARLVLVSFVAAFLVARFVVLAIMLRWLPMLYLRPGGLHVHHYSYGILLLACVGAYTLFCRPTGWRLNLTGIAYGAALALLFDEFGMWMRLGGPYWQQASFIAVLVVAAVLTVVAFAPARRPLSARHWLVAGALSAALIAGALMLAHPVRALAARHITPVLRHIERNSPY